MIESASGDSGSGKVNQAIRVLLFFLVVMALVAIPGLILTIVFNVRNGLRWPFPRYPSMALLFLWGMFSLWVALDARRFLAMVKEDVEPLAIGTALLALAGALNVLSALAALFFS